MATKKKTEVEVTEEIKEVEVTEEVVEEAPKKTTKKSSKKKAEVVEEAPVEAPVEEVKEEPKAEVEVVGTKVAEVVEEAPKAVEPAKVEEVKVSDDSYLVQVVSTSGIFTFKNPGLDQPKGRVYPKGAKLVVTEVSGNWGKVGENCWILLSGAVVKI